VAKELLRANNNAAQHGHAREHETDSPQYLKKAHNSFSFG
jgi:hypothetical protein